VPTLNDIDSFGGIDADEDFLLDECFRDHEAFIEAVHQLRFLILGRKGSGKTAIYRKILRMHSSDLFSFGHTFRDYPWHRHDRQKKSGVPDEECFVNSWKYLILITLSKILLNQDQSAPYNEYGETSLSTIETFVIDTYGSRDPDISQVFQPTMRLKLNGSLSLKAGPFEAKSSPQLVPISELPSIAHEVNRNLTERVIRSLNDVNKYFICLMSLTLVFLRSTPFIPTALSD
jgi:hypothetical protein